MNGVVPDNSGSYLIDQDEELCKFSYDPNSNSCFREEGGEYYTKFNCEKSIFAVNPWYVYQGCCTI